MSGTGRGQSHTETLLSIKKGLEYLKDKWRVDLLPDEIRQIDLKSQSLDFWNDSSAAAGLMKKKAELQNHLDIYTKSCQELDLCHMLLENEPDQEVSQIIRSLQKTVNSAKASCMFGPIDHSCCFLQIKSGAGGDDACEWASMILRMYLRYAEKAGYKTEIIDESVADHGIDGALIQISNTNQAGCAYGYIKHESGTHRLIRISPFSGNRQTSFAGVDVFPVLDKTIQIEILDKDLDKFYTRSSGKGGQHANVTDSAVKLHHKPTGISVSCQKERSQHKNLEHAMSALRGKIYNAQKKQQQKSEKERLASLGPIEWGQQIRSYFMHPYQLIKDDRTDHEEYNIQDVLDGEIQDFLDAATLLVEP